jgi:hypothetical protein
MPVTDSREPSPHAGLAAERPRDRYRRLARRHDEAVIQAEVRRLARALQPFGVLPRDSLKRVAGAAKWREGGFDRAIAAELRAGAIERLPGSSTAARPNGYPRSRANGQRGAYPAGNPRSSAVSYARR